MAAGKTAILTKSVVATTALTQYRAVSHAGAVPAANGRCMGFANTSAAIGERAPVDVLGTTLAEAGAAISLGAQLGLDSSGRVVTYSTGAVVGSAAFSAAGASGDVIEILLIPN